MPGTSSTKSRYLSCIKTLVLVHVFDFKDKYSRAIYYIINFLETFNNLSDKVVKKPLVVYNEVDDLSLEESFPELRMNGLAHVRGKKQRGPILIGSSRIEDPNTKKHGNRKKREKIRRIYTDPA